MLLDVRGAARRLSRRAPRMTTYLGSLIYRAGRIPHQLPHAPDRERPRQSWRDARRRSATVMQIAISIGGDRCRARGLPAGSP
jgi:hypothetical protein